jgi:hypothetical protein
MQTDLTPHADINELLELLRRKQNAHELFMGVLLKPYVP